MAAPSAGLVDFSCVIPAIAASWSPLLADVLSEDGIITRWSHSQRADTLCSCVIWFSFWHRNGNGLAIEDMPVLELVVKVAVLELGLRWPATRRQFDAGSSGKSCWLLDF